MRVLITDDEIPARLRLRSLVEELDGCEVVAEAANGAEALKLAQQHEPEVMLLDIRMPGMDGLEAARHLARLRNPPAVIFTTAYDQHALEAFESNAVDYLLKPIRRARLLQSLEKAQRLSRAQLAAIRAEENGRARTHLCVRVRGSLRLVPVRDIFYFRADHKYVSVRYTEGEVLIEESLKSLEHEFGERFVRIHRNALIARDRLEGLERGPGGRQMARVRGLDESLEVSRRHGPSVRRALKNT
ncbi:MAG: response regulator transcription factor [Gammaproteobacteria bacterium]|nr:response regulator transcription factor [Gammaproteobacteria bacterium]NIR97760.1 response regulator transcription factor [Gammaproteobacteria bacterium]NIT63470.1 response regulator transcription factor [Gammaproteobacteria bacterium]NIV20402.1 response regulator [Gammaproteobacteria bacterium]NIX10920.1 response regulator [Gammaproteobacteria bacterium]